MGHAQLSVKDICQYVPLSVGHIGYMMYHDLWEIHCYATRLVEVLEGFGTHLWDMHSYLLKTSVGCTPLSVGHTGYMMYYDLWEIHCYVTPLVEVLE